MSYPGIIQNFINMRLLEDLKKYLKTVSPYIFVIIGLFIWCIFLTECKGSTQGKKTSRVRVVTKTEVLRDTTKITQTQYIPKWYEKVTKVYITQPIDTVKVVEEYLASYMYGDTLINDTSAFIAVYDIISMNKIQGRTWEYINRRPTQIITNTTVIEEQPKWNIAIGGIFGGNTEQFSFDVGIIVSGKNRAEYQLLYGPMDNTIKLGYFYKLRK